MDSEDAKICLIAPTENLAARAKALIARQGLNVQVEVAELENAVALAKRLMKERKYLPGHPGPAAKKTGDRCGEHP